MTGLDTNVLVRYLVQDDPAQSRKANQVIAETVNQGGVCFINTIVLCETVWVLESAYDYARSRIGEVLERILLTAQFEIEAKDTIWVALRNFQQGKADFADYLIGQSNLQRGCRETVTFDSSLKGQRAFRLV